MNQTVKNTVVIALALSLSYLINTVAWSGEPRNDTFIVASSTKSMSEVVNSIKGFAKQQGWVYLGDFKIKKGQVILVKFCVKAAGKKAWKAGLKVSAMLPCGSIGVYKNGANTEISLLNPNYMNKLYPNPNLKAAEVLLIPLYKELMKTIVK